MATANSPNQGYLEKLSWYLTHRPHEVWDTFSPQQQQQMVEDDLAAATRVSMILGSLITAGLVLTIVTLIAVLLAS